MSYFAYEDYSWNSVLIILDALNINQKMYFINNANGIYKNVLLKFLTEDEIRIYNKMNFEKANGMFEKIQNIINDLENNGVLVVIGEIQDILLSKETQHFQQIAKELNLNNYDTQEVIKLLCFMNTIARNNGLISLDFVFLKENGITDELFFWLLMRMTMGYTKSDLDHILNNIFKNEKIPLYYLFIFEGLSAIIEGKNNNHLSIRLNNLAKKSS